VTPAEINDRIDALVAAVRAAPDSWIRTHANSSDTSTAIRMIFRVGGTAICDAARLGCWPATRDEWIALVAAPTGGGAPAPTDEFATSELFWRFVDALQTHLDPEGVFVRHQDLGWGGA